MRLAACSLALLALGGAACGGGSNEDLPKDPPPALASRCGSFGENVQAQLVWFRANDGTLLDGAALGEGDVAVVLAHEYPADLCAWLPYAQTLARHGFRAFVFDLRGGGYSQTATRPMDSGRFDWDVEAAADEARSLGAKKVFLVGASAGGAAVLVAGAAVSPEPAGVISLSSETQLSTNLDAMRAAPKLRAPLLLLVTRHDRYVAVEDYRKLESRAASKDKRLAVYSGDWHGWDLLYTAPFKARVNSLVLGFLNENSGREE